MRWLDLGEFFPDLRHTLGKDLGLEERQPRAAPTLARQSRLERRVLEEGGHVPAVFGRHLREQQPTVDSLFHDQPVSADLDVFNRAEFALQRQHRYFDVQVRQFIEISDRKSTRLNSSHSQISYAVFCL